MTKIDIYSGFLGAGKTTLIKKLIKEAYAGEKIVLIENEFGEIGVDGGFLQDAGVNVTEMNSGCICCTLVGDFAKALKQVAEKYSPDRIIIEPSGVGKLSDVIRAAARAELKDAALNVFCAVVDANKCKMYMKNFGEFFTDQVENASCIVLSHTAGIPEDKLQNCLQLLKTVNSKANYVTADWDKLDGKTILAAMERTDCLEDELKKLAEEYRREHDEDEHDHEHEHEQCCCHHDHDEDEDEHEHEHEHEHGRGHHHHHADEVFTSWGIETAHKFTEEELKNALAALQDEEKYGAVLRAKGIVAGEEHWWHFDYVPGEADVRSGGAIVTGRLCVIGCKLNEAALTRLFKA